MAEENIEPTNEPTLVTIRSRFDNRDRGEINITGDYNIDSVELKQWLKKTYPNND